MATPYRIHYRYALIFRAFNFVARTDYENILTTKISRFTVCAPGIALSKTSTYQQEMGEGKQNLYKEVNEVSHWLNCVCALCVSVSE